MGDTKLLPCPFCGGPSEIDYHKPEELFLVPVSCLACGATTGGSTEPEAIAAWNTRPALLARQEGEWLPIESAPKDRPVIITNGDAVGEASYHESDGGWWWAGYHPTDAADGYVWQPSHWRPLPALPAARSGGGG